MEDRDACGVSIPQFSELSIERIHLRDRVGKCVRLPICAESGAGDFDDAAVAGETCGKACFQSHAAIFRVATHSQNRNLFRMAKRRSFLAELLDFIVQNKAWVIAPIILVLLLAGLLILLGSTKAAPFIYTLF
jgi:hypothetical protein